VKEKNVHFFFFFDQEALLFDSFFVSGCGFDADGDDF